jgi:S1-C subfamily serine protease
MPDYTYSGDGIRADGVTDGKLAQRIGIIAGDIILQIGNYTFSDMQSYMGTLNKFSKGEAAKVKVKRGNKEIFFDVVF